MSGWRPLPGVRRNNVGFLRRQNRARPFLHMSIVLLLLASGLLAALIL